MPFTSLAWRSLGISSLRILLIASKDKILLRHRPSILPQIALIGTKLRPVAKLSFAFGLFNLSNERLLNAPAPESLTHEYLLTQASNLAAASSQQLMILTVAAIVDIAQQYRQCMEQLMCLMENTLEVSVNSQQASIWDDVVAMRIKVEELKKRLRDLSNFMEHVDKLAVGTAQVSYFAGTEHVSSSMCELINSAHAKIKEEYEKTKSLEREFLHANKQFVEKACEIEKQLKQREGEVKERTKAYYHDQLPKEDECKG